MTARSDANGEFSSARPSARGSVPPSRTMRLLDPRSVDFFAYFLRAYPLRSAIMVVLLTLAGFLEGVGVVTLLPLLELLTGAEDGAGSGVSLVLVDLLGRVGLEPTLGVLLLIIFGAMSAKALLVWTAMRQVGFTIAQVTTDLRMELLRALLEARWRYYISQSAGRFGNAISTEARRAAAAYREGCSIVAGVIQVIAYSIIALLISWQIALAALVAGSLMLFVLRGLVGMAREAGQDQTDLMRSLISRLTDALRGIKPVRAMGKERHLRPLLEGETRGLNDALRKEVNASETLRLLHEPIVTGMLALGLFAAFSFGDFTFAAITVMAFVFYRLMAHVRTLQGRYQILTVGESAFWSLMEQVEEAREEREPRPGDRPPPALREGITLDDVHFSYGSTPVLRGFSAEIPARSFTALHGPSGTGKSTIADLVVGFHEPERGRVLVDGVPLDEIDLDRWRDGIGYVPQEIFLFHDTVFRNVTLGDDSIPEDAVRQALEAAGAWDFVAARPAGLKDVLGEGGARLSGGQRQRIAIARALVHEPRLLILDEATTGLDPETERAILETLRALADRVTILAISHQPGVIEVASHILELTDGRRAPTSRTLEPVPAPPRT